MKRPKEMDIPENINPYFVWDWEAIESGAEKFDQEKFDLIPNFIQEKIKGSLEYAKYAVPGEAASEVSQPAENGGSVTTEDW